MHRLQMQAAFLFHVLQRYSTAQEGYRKTFQQPLPCSKEFESTTKLPSNNNIKLLGSRVAGRINEGRIN